jgi:hypothetical protein
VLFERVSRSVSRSAHNYALPRLRNTWHLKSAKATSSSASWSSCHGSKSRTAWHSRNGPRRGGRRAHRARAPLTLANCGHPQPLLLRDGAIRPLGRAGPMAGAFDDGEWRTAEVVLRAGDVLLLYTDGVLDTVGEHERFGLERLQQRGRDRPTPSVGRRLRVGNRSPPTLAWAGRGDVRGSGSGSCGGSGSARPAERRLRRLLRRDRIGHHRLSGGRPRRAWNVRSRSTTAVASAIPGNDTWSGCARLCFNGRYQRLPLFG